MGNGKRQLFPLFFSLILLNRREKPVTASGNAGEKALNAGAHGASILSTPVPGIHPPSAVPIPHNDPAW